MKLKMPSNKVKKAIIACLVMVVVLIPITKKDSIIEVLSNLSEQNVGTYYSDIGEYQQARWTEIQNAVFGEGVATSVVDTNLLTAAVQEGNPYFNWTDTSSLGITPWNGTYTAPATSTWGQQSYSTVVESGQTASRTVNYTTFDVATAEEFYYVLETYKNSSAGIKVNITNDIDLNGANYTWNPIALSNQYAWFYIEGNGHTIYNINTNSGLFGNITKYFVVKNLNFESVKIVANKMYVGLLGRKTTGNQYIENVHLRNAYVQNDNSLTAPLIANAKGVNTFIRNCTTENCYIYSSGEHTGGFSTIFDGSSASGTSYNVSFPEVPEAVFTSNDSTANSNYPAYPAMIENCYSINSEIFSALGHSGGFISCSNGGTVIRNSYTNNTIYGNQCVGDFIGMYYDADYSIKMYDDTDTRSIIAYFENCYASGIVEGTGEIGGFIGNSPEVVFKNCYSTAAVGMEYSGSYVGGFVGKLATRTDPVYVNDIGESKTGAIFMNCYAAGEVGDISTDTNVETATTTTIGGFLGGYDSADMLNFKNCYYDMQTSGMREVAVGATGNTGENCQLEGVAGVFTKGSESKQVKGLTTTTGNYAVNMGDDNAWEYKEGFYPQLKTLANSTNAITKNYSLASTATVFLNHWDEIMNDNGEFVECTDKTVYDTVRDITSSFEFTSLENSVWSVDSNRNDTKGYIEELVIKDGTNEVKTVPVLQIVKSNDIYKCYTFAPGKSWTKVEVGTDNKGIRRLRLLPTAYLYAGELVNVNLVSNDTGTSVLQTDITINGTTTENTKYTHYLDSIYTITSAENLADNLVKYPGQVTSKDGNAENLFAQWSTYPSTGTDLEDIYGQALIGDSDPNGKTKVEIYKLGIKYSTEDTGDTSVDDSTIAIPEIDYDSAVKLEGATLDSNEWNGIDTFDFEDKGWYEIRYYWKLNDGRYLYDSKIVVIDSDEYEINAINNLLNSKKYYEEGKVEITNDFVQDSILTTDLTLEAATEADRDVNVTVNDNTVVKSKKISNFHTDKAIVGINNDENHIMGRVTVRISNDGNNWIEVPVELTDGYETIYSYLYQETEINKNEELKEYYTTKVGDPVKVEVKLSTLVENDNTYLMFEYLDDGATAAHNSNIEVVADYITLEDITVTKIWDDENNEKRPESIKLTLTDGTNLYEKEVTEADGWKFTVEDLPTSDVDNNLISYTVDEEEINANDLMYYSKQINNYEITNTLKVHEITTLVAGEGGTISGQDETPYEKVEHTASSTKDIVVKADEGYRIKNITLTYEDGTTENVEITGTVTEKTLDKFTNMTQGVTVTAEFEKIPAKVIVKYVDANTSEVIEEVTMDGFLNETYTAEEKVLDGYKLVETPDNASGVYTEEDIEVIYYYKKVSAGVEVKYVDQATGTEIETPVTMNGLEKDPYTTEAKEVSGYVLVTTPDNATGEMTVDKITVTYEYRKLVNVEVRYVDENSNEEIITPEIQNLKEGDTYTTEKKDFDGYTYTKDTGNTTGTIGNADVEVVYYYKKISDGVEIKYIDQVTGEELVPSETIEGLEKDEYETEPKDIPGYVLVVTPDNADGEMTEEKTTVIYEYRKIVNVVAKYIDENTNEEIVESITQTLKEGDTYTTEQKSFDGYTYTKDTGNVTGTLGNTDVEVTYYYKKISGGVEIKYIDQATGDEIETPVTITGLEKDSYTAEVKDIPGYVLVVTPDNATGEMTEEKITVTYEYRKLVNVEVRYVDENTNEEIITPEIQNLKEGDTYTTEKKEFDGYTYTKDTGNTTGTIGNADVEVVYYYKKISDGVEIKYIDQVTGEELVPSKTIEGLEKDEYETEPKDIPGYVLVVTPDNADGEMTEEKTTVIYEYRKIVNVVSKYIDENTNEELAESITQTLKEGDEYTTEKKSFPEYAYTKDTGNVAGTLGNTDVEVIYYYKKVSDGVEIKYIDQVTGEEIAPSETIEGLEKDEYETEPKDIPGYELVVTPDNADGELTEDKITIIYEYRKLSDVIVKYVDENTNEEIVAEEVQTLKEGDTYTTEKKEIDGYAYTKDTGNTTGTLGNTDIEVTYYYKKISDGVEIKYIDQVTGEELVPSETIEGLEKDEYETEPKDIPGYELVVTPDNATGEMTEEKTTVIYEYRKIVNVVAKYLDENTNEEIVESITQTLKEGDEYTTEKKSFDNYVYTKDTGNVAGTLGNTDVEVIYYYKKPSKGVEVKYIDQVTGEEIETPETTTGLEKDEYETEPKEIPGYELVVTPDNADGEMTEDKTTVIYEYRKLSDVVVKYIDENTNEEIIPQESQTLKEGDEYEAEKKEFDGYAYTKDTGNTSGIVERTDIEVTYYYKKVSNGVEINYIDQVTGEEIAPSETIEGLEKDEYETEPKDIPGYELVVTPDNTTGELTEEKITVTYEYRKLSDVVVKYIDENSGEEIVPQESQTLKEGDEYTSERKEFDGYTFIKDTENTSGTLGNTDIEVIYYYKKISNGVEIKYIDQATGEELVPTETLEGLEKDEYETEPKEIPGYELVVTPDNTTGEMTEEKITVTYEYRKIVNVVAKYIDIITNEEIIPQESQTLKEGDTYTTEEKSFDGYTFIENIGQKEGTLGKDDVEVTYYYRKVSNGLEIKYIDQVTGEEIATKDIRTGLEGDEYTTIAKTVEGYELVLTPDNANGKLTTSLITIVYEYRKLSDVSVKYVDENTGVEIAEGLTQTYKQGDEYTTEKKEIAEYTYTRDTENTSGTVEDADIEVIYYYKKVSEGLEIKYIDQATGEEIAPTETIEGLENEEYTTEPKEIPGYELVKTPENASGNMTLDKTTITYEYRKLSNVITEHIDAITGEEIAEDVIKQYKEGDEYQVLAQNIPGYALVEEPEEKTGIMGREDVTKVFKYKKVSSGIVVKYIDEISNELLAEKTYTGNENDEVTLEELELDGYVLTEKPEETTVKLTVDPQEFYYYYRKLINIEVIIVDKDTGEELYNKTQSGAEDTEYTTEPVEIPGYELVEEPENKNGTYKEEGEKVIYVYRKIAGTVTVKYVDKDTNEVLESYQINGYVGDEYSTEQKTFEDYNFIDVVGDPNGKLEENSKVIVYNYEKKTGKVVITYEDEEGNILYTEELEGKVKDEYTIDIKDIPNYEVIQRPESMTGTYKEGVEEVKIIVEKLKGKVKVNFVDKDGNKIADSIITEGKVDEEYYFEAEEKDGYKIVENATIKVKYINDVIEINVVYEQIPLMELPETGDINVVLCIVIALASIVIISKKVLSFSKK